MLGGKPVTVQVAGSKTFTLLGNQIQQLQPGVSSVQKIVRLPSASTVVTTTTNAGEQPKLMVVQRPKQPTATIGINLYLIILSTILIKNKS